MYIKNVLMDANEGLYIDLTDIRQRLDNISFPDKDEPDTVDPIPTPIEETDYESVVWGDVSIGETAKFYAWQACYYTYAVEDVTYTVTTKIYDHAFWRGRDTMLIEHVYTHKRENLDEYYETKEYTYGLEALFNESTNSFSASNTVEGTVAVNNPLTIATQETKTVKATRITRQLVSNAIIYTTKLPDSYNFETIPTTEYKLHENTKLPYDITSTKTVVTVEEEPTKLYSSFDYIDGISKSSFYMKAYPSYSQLQITRINWLHDSVRVFGDFQEEYYYITGNSTSYETTISNYLNNSGWIKHPTGIDAMQTTFLSNGSQAIVVGASGDYADTSHNTDLVTETNTAIDTYLAKDNREDNDMPYNSVTLTDAVTTDNLVYKKFSGTNFYGCVPVYLYDTTGMKMVCACDSFDKVTINNKLKYVYHFMPVITASSVYINNTTNYLRSELPTTITGTEIGRGYGGFIRVPSKDKEVPLRGIWIAQSQLDNEPQDISDNPTDPYHVYYISSKSEYGAKNAVNAKLLSNYTGTKR